MKSVMCAVAVLVAVPAFADEKREVRALAVNSAGLNFSTTDQLKPVEIKSADDLAKSPVFRDDDTRDAVEKQVDFSKEKLVVFVWKGSSTDKLGHGGLSKDGKVAFTYKAGLGDDMAQVRGRVFAVPKEVKVEFEDKSGEER